MQRPDLPFESPYLRNFGHTKHEVVEHAAGLIHSMCAATGRTDLGNTDVLDVGCGVRFTQAILAYELPLKSYYGIDVYGAMIDFLNQQVDDRRFSFRHHDVTNALYNPDATHTLATSPLPAPEAAFDLICGFSLFTHLAPTDFRLMLTRMRTVARPDAWLYFTAFIDELTPGGLGFVDEAFRALGASVADQLPEADRADYREGNPDVPLEVSLYSRRHAFELIDGSGWRVEAVNDPAGTAQHQFVCRAV